MTDDEFLRYYDGEMRYLKAAGLEFAEKFPEKARELGLDSSTAPLDDSVNRLFQGFAFMMARIRQKIDDDVPELTEPLLSHLLPIVNRQLPSLAVVELSPDQHAQVRDEVMPVGTELFTQPIDASGLRCPYRTTEALTLHPLDLETLTHSVQADGRQVLTLRFAFSPQADLSQMNLSSLPLYINADPALRSALYLALGHHVQQLAVRLAGNPDSQPFAGKLQSTWQQSWTSLWPDSHSPALCGEVRPWLEYFTFPARFAFMTLSGLETITFPEGIRHFDIEITLSTPLPRDLPVTADALRIHCVPVINLFTLNAEPLHLHPVIKDYRLRPHRLRDHHTEIYSVDIVSGTETQDSVLYTPYSQFRHKSGLLKYEKEWPERYFHTRMQRGPHGLNDTVLMLGGRAFEQDQREEDPTLFLNMTCTNGNYPRMALQSAVFDGRAVVGNLTLHCRTRHVPTLPGYPPTTERYQWQVMSLLHPQALANLMETGTLRHALSLLNWTHDPNNARRIEGIQHVSYKQIHYPGEGWHGVAISVTLDENQYSGIGDARLFSEILEQFYTQYASISRLTQLTVTLKHSGIVWAWPERRLKRILF